MKETQQYNLVSWSNKLHSNFNGVVYNNIKQSHVPDIQQTVVSSNYTSVSYVAGKV